MDRIVQQAMAKWPDVPACTGWLALDRRGRFRMRDEACQAADEPGEPIRHAALNAFIARNYTSDAEGRWFFQNGPQRVFVDLDYTPLVVRLHYGTSDRCIEHASADGARLPVLIDQCALPFMPHACWCDDQGSILFSGQRGETNATDAASWRDATNATEASRSHIVSDTVALLYDQDLDLFLTLFPETAHQMAALLETMEPTQTPVPAPDDPRVGANEGTSLRWPGIASPLPCHVISTEAVAARFAFCRRPVV